MGRIETRRRGGEEGGGVERTNVVKRRLDFKGSAPLYARHRYWGLLVCYVSVALRVPYSADRDSSLFHIFSLHTAVLYDVLPSPRLGSTSMKPRIARLAGIDTERFGVHELTM